MWEEIDGYLKGNKDELWTYIVNLGDDESIHEHFRLFLYDLFMDLQSVLDVVPDDEVVDAVTAAIESIADNLPDHLPKYCFDEGPCDIESLRGHLARIANAAFYYRKDFHFLVNNYKK